MTMDETPQITETETEKGVVREGYLPDGSYVKIEYVLNEEEL